MEKHIKIPMAEGVEKTLRAGDSVLLTGTLYTARDAAHERIINMIARGEELPFEINGNIIYYVGPSPEKPGNAIGSAGPTTSYRMDKYTPTLLYLGLKGMIGKGMRSKFVEDSIKINGAVYFAAIGGAAALIGKSIKKSEIIAFEDLGSEAVRRLEVMDFPCIVVIDSLGNNFYISSRAKFLNE